MYTCGIDVGKRQHVAIVLGPDGETAVSDWVVQNNRDGFDELVRRLLPFKGGLLVGLEATGHYWLSVYETLSRNGFEVIVLNPMQIHAFRKTGIRKRKTDRLDASWIADFVRVARVTSRPANVPALQQLKELSRFRHHLTQQIGDLKRKIISVLDRVFPEYETLFSDVFLASSRKLLAEAVTPDDFIDLDLGELAELLRSASRGRFGLSQAEALQSAARRSVGVSFLTDAVHVEMTCMLAQIDLLEQQQAEVDRVLEQLMAQIPQHITSITGIGPVTGASILAEIGDVRRFDASDKLVAYAGIDATVFQTGQFKGDQAHMSKRGSPYLRNALWQAATSAIRRDPEIQAYYAKKRAEGKHHNVVMGAVCNKLLNRIYIILKENRPYVIRNSPTLDLDAA